MGAPGEAVSLVTLSHPIERHLRPIRGYPLKKIQENNEAEIMEVVLDEVRSSYAPEIVVELKSESTEDLESNVARIVQWIEAWRKDHGAATQ